jgi:hypothetical protein
MSALLVVFWANVPLNSTWMMKRQRTRQRDCVVILSVQSRVFAYRLQAMIVQAADPRFVELAAPLH